MSLLGKVNRLTNEVIASVSLLGGGIGIMNIMLVSVTDLADEPLVRPWVLAL